MAGGILIVQRGAVGPYGRQCESGGIGGPASVDPLLQAGYQRRNGPGVSGVRCGSPKLRRDQQVIPVPRKDFPPVEPGLAAGKKLGHSSQNEVPQTQGITGNEAGLADSLHSLQGFQILRQDRLYPLRLQKRRHLRLEMFRVEEQRKAVGDPGDEFRKERLDPPGADLSEQTACPESLFDRIPRGDQGVTIAARAGDIDHQPVLDREVPDDPMGIRQNGIVEGNRFQNIRFDPEEIGFVNQNRPQDHRDKGDQWPVESVAGEGHLYVLPRTRRKILRKIRRVNVSEFLQKSTKGRKWEILLLPGA